MCPYPLYRAPREEFQKTTWENMSKSWIDFIIIIPPVITEVHHNILTAIYILSDYISKVNAKTPLLNTQNSLDIYFMIVKNGLWDEMEEETGKPSSISLKAKVGEKGVIFEIISLKGRKQGAKTQLCSPLSG